MRPTSTKNVRLQLGLALKVTILSQFTPSEEANDHLSLYPVASNRRLAPCTMGYITHHQPCQADATMEIPRGFACGRLTFFASCASIFLTWSTPGFLAASQVPLSYFAPEVKKQSSPFEWTASSLDGSFLNPNAAQAPDWNQWLRPIASPSRLILSPPSPPPVEEAWQPAPVDENAPLMPPDGMPLAVQSPLPGIDEVSGNCAITGEVSDVSSLNPVAGALIDVIGTGRTAESDSNGRFTIGGLPSATYTLEVNKLGYTTESSVATTLEGQPVEVRFGLRPKPSDDSANETTLEEETIVGEYQGDSAGDFNLTLEVDSPALTATMGREEFAKTGVSDAGEAIGKVSGANIVDGKYAVVRGLADRYVSTLFNGAQVASADPSKKALQLDLFPTSVIEAIAVDKTWSAHLPGDFGGGSINIITRAFPEERFLSYKHKYSVNDGLSDEFYAHPGEDLNFWGDNRASMPYEQLETTDPQGKVDFLDSASNGGTDEWKSQLAEYWSNLHQSQNLKPILDDSEPGYSHSLSYGETFKFENNSKLGVIAAFSQSSGDSSNTTDVVNPVREYIKDEYKRSAETAAFISTAFEIAELHKLQATWFDKHIAEDKINHNRRILEDTENLNYGRYLPNKVADPNSGNDYGADAIYYGQSWGIETVLRDLEILQLKGEHKIFNRGPQINWSITESDSAEVRPHSSTFNYGVLDFSASAYDNKGKSLAQYKAESDALFQTPEKLALKAVVDTLPATAAGWAQTLMNEGKIPNGDPSTYTWESIKVPWTTTGTSSLNRTRSRQYNNLNRDLTNYNQGMVILNEDLGQVETVVHGTYSGSVEGKQYSLRRYESTTEDTSDHQVAFTLPCYFDDHSDDRLFELSGGSTMVNRQRQSKVRAYDLIFRASQRGYAPGSLEGPGGKGEQIYDDPSIMAGDFTGNDDANASGPYYTNALALRGVENIDTELEQDAKFINARLQFDKTFINAGLRKETETYEIDIKPSPEAGFTAEQIDLLGWESRDAQKDILPSAAVGTSFFDGKIDLLGAWSRTVARPTFWEFVPTETLDQGTGLGRRGNNLLTTTLVENRDLAIGFNLSNKYALRFSFFNKDLERPLVTFYEDSGALVYKDSYIRLDNDTKDIVEQRDYTGKIRGLEVEAECREFGPFSLKGNFTYIDARLDYFYEEAGVVDAVTSSLPYQPSTIVNFTLGYEHEPWDSSVYLVCNFTGDYPVVLKRNDNDTGITREALVTFDLLLEKRIETDFLDFTLRAGIKNLTEAEDHYLYGEETYELDALGRTYWIEAEVSF